MAFDYDKMTKQHYKNREVAHRYHQAFTSRWAWDALRFRFIAYRERQSVAELIRRIEPRGILLRSVLDIPCGTGKLAEVWAAFGCKIVAADISTEMLEIARRHYAMSNVKKVEFSIGDVETLAAQFGPDKPDVVVCLRLLHRVPPMVRETMLDQIGKTARFGIISFGVDSQYHRMRRRVRSLFYGLPSRGSFCQESMSQINKELAKHFKVIQMKWIAKYLSEEVLFLVERRTTE
jgi:SAM-dependent methyltransferase